MTVQAQLRRPRCLMTGCLTVAGLLSACLVMTAATAQDRAPDYAAVVAAPDRTEADVQTDKRRDPVKLLAFTGAHPGIKVLDMGAGGGYSTELMARAVAPSGVVYGQNPADIGERAKLRAWRAASDCVAEFVSDGDQLEQPDSSAIAGATTGWTSGAAREAGAGGDVSRYERQRLRIRHVIDSTIGADSSHQPLCQHSFERCRHDQTRGEEARSGSAGVQRAHDGGARAHEHFRPAAVPHRRSHGGRDRRLDIRERWGRWGLLVARFL